MMCALYMNGSGVGVLATPSVGDIYAGVAGALSMWE